MKEEKIREFIVTELKRFFHTMSEKEILEYIRNYKSVKDKEHRAGIMRERQPPPTDYNEDVIERFGSRQKTMKAITKQVQSKVAERFFIMPERKIENTNFLIDLFDQEAGVCYEIALGDGAEVFKDIIKAILVNANKLIVFSRSYPNPWGMIGYDYIKRHWEAMKNRIKLEVEIIAVPGFQGP